MREGGTPPSVEGQWRLVHEAAYACAVFSAKTLGTPLSPCSTLVSTSCLNSVGTRVQPPPPPDWSNPQACTWPSWSFLLVSVRSNSNREKLRQKSLPGSWVLASQTDKASFQLVFLSCEVCVCICVFKCIIKQRCKAAVVKQAELFKLCKYNRATGVTQYGKYLSRKPFLCPFCASLSYLK